MLRKFSFEISNLKSAILLRLPPLCGPLPPLCVSAIKFLPLGFWSLGFSWDLDFGVWDFDLSPSVFISGGRSGWEAVIESLQLRLRCPVSIRGCPFTTATAPAPSHLQSRFRLCGEVLRSRHPCLWAHGSGSILTFQQSW
jgi:hypothetical protein